MQWNKNFLGSSEKLIMTYYFYYLLLIILLIIKTYDYFLNSKWEAMFLKGPETETVGHYASNW